MTLEERVLHIARELAAVSLIQMGFTPVGPILSKSYHSVGEYGTTEAEFANGCDRVKLEIRVRVTRPETADSYGGE